jgi:hypothetical protein
MRKTPCFLVCLCLSLLLSNTVPMRADTADTVRILVARSDDQTAKVTIGARTYLVSIEFESGMNFSWDDVKDGYELPPAYVSLMKQGRILISITCSGTSFEVVSPNKKK